MGMVFDPNYPAVLPATPRARKRKRARRIEEDTSIAPYVVARGVWEDACVWLGEELPREWVNRLVARANRTYARNPRFRKIIRLSGSEGRDSLWAFTRHWLVARIKKYRPDLHARLPGGYHLGYDLPERTDAVVTFL